MNAWQFVLINLFGTGLELWVDNVLLKDFPLEVISVFFTCEKRFLFG